MVSIEQTSVELINSFPFKSVMSVLTTTTSVDEFSDWLPVVPASSSIDSSSSSIVRKPFRVDARSVATDVKSQGLALYRPPSNGTILCANCGCAGHVYRVCNHPITSFGIICIRWRSDDNAPQGIRPQYLMVQRKDSLCFVEFVRGKYNLQNRTYLLKLFRSMTPCERSRVAVQHFDDLWSGFWQTSDQNRNYVKEYLHAKEKFDSLKSGYYVRDANTKDLSFFDLQVILSTTEPNLDETEWGFPKGRRNINENDIRCALREFREETGIDTRGIVLHHNIKPFEEVFTGCNKVRYRHVYYLAQVIQEHALLDNGEFTDGQPLGRLQQREVRSIKWFDDDAVLSKISVQNVERREMFKRVNGYVLQQQRVDNVWVKPWH